MKVIHVLRKPCSEPTVAANVLRWGTGALNIDACRISATDAFGGGAKATSGFVNGYAADGWVAGSPLGRWPANLVLQHLDGCHQICAPGCPVAALDAQSGVSKSTGGRLANISKVSTIYGGGKGLGQDLDPDLVRGDPGFGDTGGASRFFKQISPRRDGAG